MKATDDEAVDRMFRDWLDIAVSLEITVNI
jgi:hypothetical protein